MLKDRISEIPDEILSFTLSFLPMKEAAKTSILSRRWRYLWKTSLAFYSSFNLDVVTWRGSAYPNNMFFIHERPGVREDSSLVSMERFKFVEWVNQTLQLVNSPVMESFSLQYYLKKDFTLYIDQWITMAISKSVQNLEIDLSPFQNSWGVSHYLKELYTFPYRLFTQETGALVKCLRLNSCILGTLGLNYFSSLVDLRLEQVLINQENFGSFFSNCPNLENLCLIECWRLRRLEISGGFLKLKSLSIVKCSLAKIIIDARNLTKLEYWGAGVNFSFISVPQLSNVIVSIQSQYCSAALTLTLRWLSRFVPKLESLVIMASPIKQKTIPSQFVNLKKLVLMTNAFEGTLWGFIPLLHASPYLHKLELHWWPMSFEKCEAGLGPELSDSVHLYLKKIVLTGFNGSTHEIEFATYLLNSTAALRKMTISNTAKRYNPQYGFFKSAEVASEKKKKMEERARKQLMNVVPSGVELLFL